MLCTLPLLFVTSGLCISWFVYQLVCVLAGLSGKLPSIMLKLRLLKCSGMRENIKFPNPPHLKYSVHIILLIKYTNFTVIIEIDENILQILYVFLLLAHLMKLMTALLFFFFFFSGRALQLFCIFFYFIVPTMDILCFTFDMSDYISHTEYNIPLAPGCLSYSTHQ